VTENIYIKFTDTSATPEAKKKSRWRIKLVTTILFFIPKANPEYEGLIDDVAEWQLEIDPSDNLPIREIGKDLNGNTILIMPWLDNYGYWTDNNITLDYFKDHFKATDLDKAEFKKNWDAYANKNPDLSN
jgi:hypothetical protein